VAPDADTNRKFARDIEVFETVIASLKETLEEAAGRPMKPPRSFRLGGKVH
jgi:hypothetical protein